MGCVRSDQLLRFGKLHRYLFTRDPTLSGGSQIDTLREKIQNDPASEEQQGRNAALAAQQAGISCFIWSTLPSSLQISGGEVCCEIYEGKYRVDSFIRDELKLESAVFMYTGNFYENMVLRRHIVKVETEDGKVEIEFRHPVIQADTKRESGTEQQVV